MIAHCTELEAQNAGGQTVNGTGSRVVCDLCGLQDCGLLWRLDLPGHPATFQLFKCGACGVVFNHPRLTGEQLRRQYDGNYYVFNESPAQRWARVTQLYAEHLLELEARSTGRRLLEIGCASGELLALARERGWQVQGIEISSEAADSATRRYGLDVLPGTLEEHAGHLDPFDVGISTDVIEHVQAPADFLSAFRRVIRPGGWVSIETPNYGSAWRRLGGRKWLGINRFHIYLFDARSLMMLMARCGFWDCAARSSTNLTYAAWGSRPELHALLHCLPAGLRWRAEALADRLTPRCLALDLQQDPPDSLDSAVTKIDRLSRQKQCRSSHLFGDNLTVIGRA